MKEYYSTKCYNCGGHGQVSDYGFGLDFYGAMECEDCRGSGKIVVYKNDATAAWPGGPMTGSWPGKFEELKKKTK